MNMRRSVMTITAALVAICGLSLGQQVDDNPFPDVIARSAAIRPFVLDGSQLKLSGTITQAPVHIRPQNPYQYFRMSVTRDNTTEIWAVLIWSADSDFEPQAGSKGHIVGYPNEGWEPTSPTGSNHQTA